jgi:hypothetical protein
MDLNELPPALEGNFLDALDLDYVIGNPIFCTQVFVMNFLSLTNILSLINQCLDNYYQIKTKIATV